MMPLKMIVPLFPSLLRLPMSIFFPNHQTLTRKKNPNNMQSLLRHLLPPFLPQHKTVFCLWFGRLHHEPSPTFPTSCGQSFLLLISILSRYKMLYPQTSSSGHGRLACIIIQGLNTAYTKITKDKGTAYRLLCTSRPLFTCILIYLFT